MNWDAPAIPRGLRHCSSLITDIIHRGLPPWCLQLNWVGAVRFVRTHIHQPESACYLSSAEPRTTYSGVQAMVMPTEAAHDSFELSRHCSHASTLTISVVIDCPVSSSGVFGMLMSPISSYS